MVEKEKQKRQMKNSLEWYIKGVKNELKMMEGEMIGSNIKRWGNVSLIIQTSSWRYYGNVY